MECLAAVRKQPPMFRRAQIRIRGHSQRREKCQPMWPASLHMCGCDAGPKASCNRHTHIAYERGALEALLLPAAANGPPASPSLSKPWRGHSANESPCKMQ